MNFKIKEQEKKDLMLWYLKPATKWTEALPLGNGHIGAMIYGGVNIEKIALTENTCFSGEASGENNQKGAADVIPSIREALFNNEYEKAGILSEKIIGQRLNYGTNLPFGNLILYFSNQSDEVTDYSRGLQLNNAVATVEYKAGNVRFSREVFISNPNNVVAIRITCSEPGKLDFMASLDGAENPHSVEIEKNGDLILKGHAYESIHSDGKTGVALHGRLRIVTENGIVTTNENKLWVKKADTAVILLTLGTDFINSDVVNTCMGRINAASVLKYMDLRNIHIKSHQRLFNRVNLELGSGNRAQIPTDQRLTEVKNGSEDPSLIALMFQYGRYLLMSSSREDSVLPAHLQGIWNDNIACCMGWTCDMHLDINTQMNYWPTEVTNLAECNTPLFKWLEQRLIPSGRQTAKVTYGLDGWVAHVVSNAWGYSAPGWSTSWGIHPTGGLWVATQLWEHYLFTKDIKFLGEQVYPVYREAAVFFLKYLAKDPKSSYFLSGPSMSPENSFAFDLKNSITSSISMGTVCDTVMIRELFNSFVSICEVLSIDDDLLDGTKKMLGKLPPFQIGKQGQLQEWFWDFDEPDPHHRHTSHLLSVFPFCQINPEATPELAEAAKISIKNRITPMWRWEDTAWARALLILYSARLWEPEETYRHILAFQRGLTNDNLLSFCPPGAGAETNVFEMDGTTGLCTGIAEMLLQSHDGALHILPTLPKQWDRGFVKGLRARGGFEINIKWQENELVNVEIYSEQGEECWVKYKDKRLQIQLEKGKKCLLDENLVIKSFSKQLGKKKV